jgi:16S rRNA (uracil1498-N3)-methyltransferase
VTSDHFFIAKARAQGDVFVLDGREHHHLSTVLRARPGDVVVLFDEDGAKYSVRIEEITAAATTLSCLSRTPGEIRRTRIVLAQALLKSKAMDFVVQKAAELGLAEFFPVAAARSVSKIEPQGGRKIERWEQIAREASKQSRLGLGLRIHPPRSLSAFLADPPAAMRLYLNEHGGPLLKDLLRGGAEAVSAVGPDSVAVLVGPEGGWTPEEQETIAGHGFEPVSLGRPVLRAETAALSAAALLSHFWSW